MNNFKRYRVRVLVRPDSDAGWNPDDSGEHEYRADLTAQDELDARRRVIYRAYHAGYLVSRFLQITEKVLG